jgi:hypothetical protein
MVLTSGRCRQACCAGFDVPQRPAPALSIRTGALAAGHHVRKAVAVLPAPRRDLSQARLTTQVSVVRGRRRKAVVNRKLGRASHPLQPADQRTNGQYSTQVTACQVVWLVGLCRSLETTCDGRRVSTARSGLISVFRSVRCVAQKRLVVIATPIQLCG